MTIEEERPPLPATPYASVEDVRRAVNAPAGAAVDADLDTAVWAATTVLTYHTGQAFDPVPPPIHIAAIQLAVRFFTADDVARGIYSTDLGVGFTGRFITPEIEALLIGQRVSFGVA